MKRIQYLRKHMRTQREPTQLCRTLQQFERRGSRSIKKLKLIDFSKKSRLKELKEFFSFSVSLLSLLSSEATQ
jgi:hypothetical protein